MESRDRKAVPGGAAPAVGPPRRCGQTHSRVADRNGAERRWPLRGWLCALLLWLAAAASPLLAQAASNSDCFICHDDKTLTETTPQGKVISLYVDPARFAASVHGSNACTSCHRQITEEHPEGGVTIKPVTCVNCHPSQPSHQKAAAQYALSIHGYSRELGGKAAATCSDCHGSHYIKPVTNENSPVFKLNLPFTCAKCHSNLGLTRAYEIRHPRAPSEFIDSIHGRALLQGLIVAPSCDDCHGVHNIERPVDPDSPIYRGNVARTCGKCHLGVKKVFERSIHGQLLAKGDPRAPDCVNCHTAHQIISPEVNSFKRFSDQRCGACHPTHTRLYYETYHGKAIRLGMPNVAPEVAACYNCHGYHDVLPPSNPRSTLSKQNIVATCRKCHPGANASFTKYNPHANPLDPHYPAFYWTFVGMTTLLAGVFTFFGTHTGFWLFRSSYLYLHDSRAFREAKISAQRGGEWFVRFSPAERFLHVMVVTSFLLLVITGMPLKFYYTPWAKGIFHVLGGPAVARALHHFGAMVTLTYFSLHLFGLTVLIWRRRSQFHDPVTGRLSFKRVKNIVFGPDSMMPRLQDFRDFAAHQKWFFGKGPKPQFDRWTYWEKFDYFAVFWGVFVIGLSGLIMWCPIFFTKFLPGWIINVALIVHSDEALLAAGFIFAIHFFNSHFRLEKFPMDTVIFSGRISKTEMLHERRRWYERLLGAHRLEEAHVRDEWERWKGIARAFGYLFFGAGVVLLLLIAYAMIWRLTR